VSPEVSQQDRLIDLQIVEGAEGICQVSKDWDDLFDRAVDASPFLSRPWASTFVEEGRLRGAPLFVLARCGTRLVGLLPLAVRPLLNARIAVPIGTGQGSYLGLLLDPDYSFAVEAMADRIVSGKVFDVYCSADLYSEDVATHDLLAQLVKRGYSCRRVYRDPCPCIRLGRSYEEYLNGTKSAKSRQTLRRKERNLCERHAVNVECYNGRDVTADVIGRIACIQEQSWMKRRGAAVLGQPFYRKLLLAMAQAGFAKAWVMRIDGVDAAFVFALVAHRRIYYAWTAFKLQYASSLSVGQVLTNWTIRDACRDGILLYDFEHGDAEYKRFWSTDSCSVHRVVASRGACGSLVAGVCFIEWQLARVKWLKSFYRRLRMKLRGMKHETSTIRDSR
jgi:CelD/BcsL family acetyltransferase involved in cellulose biosynthesis